MGRIWHQQGTFGKHVMTVVNKVEQTVGILIGLMSNIGAKQSFTIDKPVLFADKVWAQMQRNIET